MTIGAGTIFQLCNNLSKACSSPTFGRFPRLTIFLGRLISVNSLFVRSSRFGVSFVFHVSQYSIHTHGGRTS